MSNDEIKVSKSYSLSPSTVEWLRNYAAQLTITKGYSVSASEIVQDAIDQYKAKQENAERRMKIKSGGARVVSIT